MLGHCLRALLAATVVVGLSGCAESIEDIDDTADIVTGAEHVRVGRELEHQLRRTANDHRDDIDDYVGVTRDFDDEEEDDDEDE